MTKNSDAYKCIKSIYGNSTAERSGVPLMNHIDEGLEILSRLGACDATKEAYCLHPAIQTDENLYNNHWILASYTPTVVMYVMEYRDVANESLSSIVKSTWAGKGPHHDFEVLSLARPIRLSRIGPVNTMLIADKVQNRKDFLRFHYGCHPESPRLDFYFKAWLEALEISDEEYGRLTFGL